MDTWTRQMGFPLITLSREGNTITAKQKRFILTVNLNNEAEEMNNESISPFGYKWYVPLSYYTNQHTGKVHHIWMNMSDGKVISKLRSFLFLYNISDSI
jgi:glutamyl aminopeptidase